MHMHGRVIADKHGDARIFEAVDGVIHDLIIAKQLHHANIADGGTDSAWLPYKTEMPECFSATRGEYFEKKKEAGR